MLITVTTVTTTRVPVVRYVCRIAPQTGQTLRWAWANRSTVGRIEVNDTHTHINRLSCTIYHVKGSEGEGESLNVNEGDSVRNSCSIEKVSN